MPFGIAAAAIGLASGVGVAGSVAIGAGVATLAGGVEKAIGSSAAGNAESNAYTTAAQYAAESGNVTAQSTAVQEMLANRKITQALGTEQADTAANGLAMSGSAAALMRSSIMQGGIQKALIQEQGTQTELGYAAQGAAYTSQAQIAKSTGTIGAVGDLIGGVAGFGQSGGATALINAL